MIEDAAIQHATAPVEYDWLMERRRNLSQSRISYERLRNSDRTRIKVDEATYAYLNKMLEHGDLHFPILDYYEMRGEKPPENIDLILEPLGFILAKTAIETAVILGLPENSVAISIAPPGELEEKGAGAAASKGTTSDYGRIRLSNAELVAVFLEMKKLLHYAETQFLQFQNEGWIDKNVSLIDFVRSLYDPARHPQFAEHARLGMVWHDSGSVYYLMKFIAHEMYHVRQAIADPQYFDHTYYASPHLLPYKTLEDFQGDSGAFEEYENERVERLPLYDRNIGELSATKFSFRYMYFVARRMIEQKSMGKASLIDRGLENAFYSLLPEDIKDIRERQAARDVELGNISVSNPSQVA